MSATNRGAAKVPQEYYITPRKTILEFWEKFYEIEKSHQIAVHESTGAVYCQTDDLIFNKILDPCCGGDADRSPTYPWALSFSAAPGFTENASGFHPVKSEWTYVDIRNDAPGAIHEDYLKLPLFIEKFDLIISNPPFTLFEQFVTKAMEDVVNDGYVIFLLRLNALGGQKRAKRFWSKYPAKYCFVHSKRPHFIPGSSKTDATEYAHFVWQKGYLGPMLTYVI